MSKTRRYPIEIPDEELDTVLKELEVSGVDYHQEGRVLLLRDPDRPNGEVVYQKHGEIWIWIDRTAVLEARKAFKQESDEASADMMAEMYKLQLEQQKNRKHKPSSNLKLKKPV